MRAWQRALDMWGEQVTDRAKLNHASRLLTSTRSSGEPSPAHCRLHLVPPSTVPSTSNALVAWCWTLALTANQPSLALAKAICDAESCAEGEVTSDSAVAASASACPELAPPNEERAAVSVSAPKALRARWGHRGAGLRRPRAFIAAKPAAGGPRLPFETMAQSVGAISLPAPAGTSWVTAESNSYDVRFPVPAS